MTLFLTFQLFDAQNFNKCVQNDLFYKLVIFFKYLLPSSDH